MNRTTTSLRLLFAVAIALVLTAACAAEKEDGPGDLARDAARTTCHQGFTYDFSMVMVDSEPVLVVGPEWRTTTEGLTVVPLESQTYIPGIDPVTGVGELPDNVICVSYVTDDATECPDGRTLNTRGLNMRASLREVGDDESLAETSLIASHYCRDGGDATPDLMPRQQPDSYDLDQILCDLMTCVLDDELAVELASLRADDPRSEVCRFGNPFVDGVIELEDGPVYVAVESSSKHSLSEAVPAYGVETARTACVSSSASISTISCGAYEFEDQPLGDLHIDQTGLDVRASWFAGTTTDPIASIASTYYSECTEEITVRTTTYGSSTTIADTFGGGPRVERSSFGPEQLTLVIQDLMDWAEVNSALDDLTPADCAALSQTGQIKAVHQRLTSHVESSHHFMYEAPAGLMDDVELLQTQTSDLVDALGDDSPLFTPVFKLWFVAHFDWPTVATFIDDPIDPEMTDEDIELALAGMPARAGLVAVSDPAFVNFGETLTKLNRLHISNCAG